MQLNNYKLFYKWRLSDILQWKDPLCLMMHFITDKTFLKVKYCHYCFIQRLLCRTHTHTHTHTWEDRHVNHTTRAALTLHWNLLPFELQWPSLSSSVQWWADGGAGEAPLRRHLYRQLQPLPQTDGCEEVSELSLNRKEKVWFWKLTPPFHLPLLNTVQLEHIYFKVHSEGIQVWTQGDDTCWFLKQTLWNSKSKRNSFLINSYYIAI